MRTGVGRPGGAAARLFASGARTDFDVEVEGDDAGHAGGGRGGAPMSRGAAAALGKVTGGPVITAAVDVASASLPEHLRVSSITGEAAKTLGFVQIQGRGGDDMGGHQGGGGLGAGELDVELVDEPLFSSSAGGYGGGGGGMLIDDEDGGGDTPFVFDTNINAGRDGGGGRGEDGAGAVAPSEDDVSNEYLWQLLFAQAQEEEEGAGAGAQGAAGQAWDGDGEHEWEDATAGTGSGTTAAAAEGDAQLQPVPVATAPPVPPPQESDAGAGAGGDDDDWEDA